MGITHKEITKVWIAPGCIVCDACETECPEVFDVQEETCVIKPAALQPQFTKPITPSIIAAAEGCPVEVIKFDTIEVEGPEPWAGKEPKSAEAVGAGATDGGGAAKKKAAPAIPSGPPDPKWAGLLTTSHVSKGASSDKAENTAVLPRRAKVPAEAVAAALPVHAPPDARAAAMVGSGFIRPKPSVSDRLRQAAQAVSSTATLTRREFTVTLAIAWGALAATAAVLGGALQAYMVPTVTKEPPTTFRAGKITDYPDVGVYEQFKNSDGVWIIRLDDGKLVALSDICTHLGCIPNWLPADHKFKCPCHGSGYYMNGVNFEGPAPRPLERFKISIEGEYLVIDKSQRFREELGQWSDPRAYVAV